MIIFIYGQDEFRAKHKLRELVDNFRQKVDPSGQNISTFSDPVDIGKVIETSRTTPLFVRRQMVVIEDVFLSKSTGSIANLLSYLQGLTKPKDEASNIIIFYEKSDLTKLNSEKKKLLEFLMASADYKFEFPKLSNTEAASWVKKEAEKFGANISQQAASQLIFRVGSDTWQLKNELDKLVNYALAQNRNSVELTDVETQVHGVIDENIFSLVDLVLRKDYKGYAKKLDEQLEAGLNEVYILSTLTRQFINLLSVKMMASDGESEKKMASDLGLHPYVVKKALQQVYYYQVDDLKEIINRLVEIDHKNKRGEASVVIEITKAFLK